MSTMNQLFVSIFVLLSYSTYVACLQCYQCANVEIKSKMSSFWGPLVGKSDPTCGAYPTQSNMATCSSNEVCGSVSGDISAMGGLFEASVQIRGCIPRGSMSESDVLGGCTDTNSLSNAAIGRMLGVLTKVPDMNFRGTVCQCAFDYCSLCDGGVNIGGYCMQYWVLGLISVGLLAAIIGMICCCCCCCGCCGCCGCCRKSSPGVIHSQPYHTLTVIQTPGAPPPRALSIQSGDILPQSTNQVSAVGGAYPVAAMRLVEEKERAGYNQVSGNFGASLS